MKTLIVFSHTNFAESRVNKVLLSRAMGVPGVKVRNLEHLYGRDGAKIDVAAERRRLEQADELVFQFPLYWFNLPPMLKAYLDYVLGQDWLFGSGSGALRGKKAQIVVTTGFAEDKFKAPQPRIGDYLLGLTTTFNMVGFALQPILVAYNAKNLSDDEVSRVADKYVTLLNPPAGA